MVTLGSWVAGLLGLLGSLVAVALVHVCGGGRVQASLHADVDACMLGFLGCWIARSPGESLKNPLRILNSWVSLIPGLLGLLNRWGPVW